MVNIEVFKSCIKFRNKTGRWPREKIIIDGKRYAKKDIEQIKGKRKRNEYLQEFDLAYKWKNSDERKILMENKNKEIEECPKEYQKMIRVLRDIGLGVDGKTVDIATAYENFYNEYGRLPGKVYKEDATTNEKKREKRLYEYWSACDENKLLEEYVSKEINEIPEEHQQMVSRFRAIGMGIVSKKPQNLENYIDFVKKEKREPQDFADPKNDDEKIERDVKHKWRLCVDHATYKKYSGVLLEEVPEEHKELVKKLRDLWLEIDGKNVADEVIEFIKENQRLPREINAGLNQFSKGVTKEEQEENDLNAKWNRCFEKQVIDRFVGVPLKNIPKEYLQIVCKLREVGLGYPETLNTRLYINYILNNKRRPRQVIIKNGKKINLDEYSKSERKETDIRKRWDLSEDRKIYVKYKNNELDSKTKELYADMLKQLDRAQQIEAIGRKEKSEKIKVNAKERMKKQNGANIGVLDEEQKLKIAKRIAEAKDELSKKEAARKKKQEEKELKSIKIAKDYLAYVKEFNKAPRKNTPTEEGTLRRNWEKSKFIDVIESYVGVPIENIPEKYAEIISEFRALGIGLTFDEYEKYRESHTGKSILKAAKTTREWAIKRKNKALELEKEVKGHSKSKGKEKGDE